MAGPRILMVCTANICRSPAAAQLLQRGIAPSFPEALVASAGTEALPGHPACDAATHLVQEHLAGSNDGLVSQATGSHRSRRVALIDLRAADLILALDRSHRSALARLDPAGRTRTLTLRQAAVGAEHVTRSLAIGELPEGAPPIPEAGAERFRWWVGELDAGRALSAGGMVASIGTLEIDPLDVPDPHVVGHQHHPQALSLIQDSVGMLSASLSALALFGERAA